MIMETFYFKICTNTFCIMLISSIIPKIMTLYFSNNIKIRT